MTYKKVETIILIKIKDSPEKKSRNNKSIFTLARKITLLT